jgi:hypothetical protein
MNSHILFEANFLPFLFDYVNNNGNKYCFNTSGLLIILNIKEYQEMFVLFLAEPVYHRIVECMVYKVLCFFFERLCQYQVSGL